MQDSGRVGVSRRRFMSLVALAAGAATAASVAGGGVAALVTPAAEPEDDGPVPEGAEPIPWEKRREMMVRAYEAFAPDARRE